MKRDLLMINQLVEVFPERNVLLCIESSDLEKNYINDTGQSQRAQFVGDNPDNEHFEIENPGKQAVYLLSVDGCFFSSNDISRCDGILFNHSDFCFFELKLNTLSKKSTKKTEKFKEGIDQLERTINFFRNEFVAKGKDFLGYKLEAYICMKDSSYPRDKASMKERKVRFLKKNGIPLFDKNRKKFL